MATCLPPRPWNVRLITGLRGEGRVVRCTAPPPIPAFRPLRTEVFAQRAVAVAVILSAVREHAVNATQIPSHERLYVVTL